MVTSKKPEDCKTIAEIRKAIDSIDKEIIRLHSQRDAYVREIVKFKADEKGIIARERKDHVIRQRRDWAAEKGLDPDLFEQLFRLMIEKNIQIQFDIYHSNNKP